MTTIRTIICKLFHRSYERKYLEDGLYKMWWSTECGKCGRVIWDRNRDQPDVTVDSSKMLGL